MKIYICKISIIVLLFCGSALYPQLDSLKHGQSFVKHLTLTDTFFGNEEMYQVCYPKDHRLVFYFIIIISITALTLGFLVVYIKHSSNKKLKKKNTIISDQNKDLIDSINYAQRIQQAILPDKKTEEQVLENGFVIYKPKHIVSGDFYWLHKHNNIIFIAVIDCTGHGVPGALLTMLAYNAINKAVLEKELTDPTLILDSMNSDVKNALKQSQNKNMQDGMEVSLICLDSETNKLTFSGANLSLLCLQNGEMKILNGGKCSVGSVQESVIQLPKTNSINVNSGDCFYLYTDGYADQFGGPKGKKFKYKQLEQLLLANHNKSTREQYNAVNSAFENWKGDLEQVDDVCVIGVKIS